MSHNVQFTSGRLIPRGLEDDEEDDNHSQQADDEEDPGIGLQRSDNLEPILTRRKELAHDSLRVPPKGRGRV